MPAKALHADNETRPGGQTAEAPEDPADELGQCANPPEQGRPVYLDTGEFALLPYELSTPEPVIPVRGFTIDLRRTYRSGYAYHGVLGYGWDLAVNRRLRRLSNGNIVLTTGTCRSSEFTFTGTGWDAPAGVFSTLVLNGDGTYTETSPNGTKDTFDADGNLIEQRDRHGNRIAFEYSEERMPILGRSQFFVDTTARIVAMEHRLLKIVDPTDREIEFTYNPQGRIATITDWIDRTWTYGYDGFGNLTSVTSPGIADYPSGTMTTYAYQDVRFPNKLTSVVPPNGQATGTTSIQNFYDTQGRVYRQEDGADGVFLFTYEPTRTVVQDPNGTTWRYTYQNRRITSETVVTRGVRPSSVEPVGTEYTTTFEYTNDLRTRTVFPEGNAVEVIYDAANTNVLSRGNVLEVRRLPKTGSSAPPLVTKYTYKTPFQQVGTIEDPRGKVTEYFYDTNHNLQRIEYPPISEGTPIEFFATNAFGQRTTVTDANNNTVKLDYDGNGYLDRVTRAFGTSLAAMTELDPDAVGRPTVVRDANNQPTQLTHNAWDGIELKVAPAPFFYETRYHYDASGNLARIEEQSEIAANPQTTTFTYNVLDWRLTSKNELNQTTTFGYDANGNTATTTAPDSNATTRIFDERNLLYQETAANGDQLRFDYHPNGRLSRIVDGNGNPTRYDYDAFDRHNLVTHADNSAEGRTYDLASRVTSSTTRSGASIAYGYDDLDRLRSRTTPEEIATFAYDLGGRMTGAANPAATLTFEYDSRDQLVSQSISLPGLSSKVVSYQYDGVGNRTRITYPDGAFVTQQYDALDRLELLRDGGVQLLSQWTYDELSRPLTRILPSGITSAWTYDRASRVATVVHSAPGGMLDSRTYGRDSTGTITSLQDLLGIYTYGYDESKQLTSVDYPAASPFPDATYEYDSGGNRLAEVAGSTTIYVPNALNQYSSVGGVPQTYDGSGNLAGDGSSAFVFDSQNRLISAETDDGAGGTVSVTYLYDAFARRTQKSVDGTVTYFLWSADDLLEEYGSQGLRTVRYIYGAGFGAAHMRSRNLSGADNAYDVHADQLESPRILTDAGGSVAWSAEYSVFGEAVISSGTGIYYNLRLPGQYFDGEIGLHYNRHRYYAPRGGRYLSVDVLGQDGAVNLYGYSGNDPVRRIDPLGLSEVVFDRSEGTLTVYPGDGKGGRAIGPPQQFPASNNVSAANAGTDPYLPEGGGRAPNGDFNVGPKVPTPGDASSALGDKGFFPIDLRPRNDKGEPQNRIEGGETVGPGRGGVGMHAGRVGVCDGAGRCGVKHATQGCVRTTPEGMDALNADPPTRIIIQD